MRLAALGARVSLCVTCRIGLNALSQLRQACLDHLAERRARDAETARRFGLRDPLEPHGAHDLGHALRKLVDEGAKSLGAFLLEEFLVWAGAGCRAREEGLDDGVVMLFSQGFPSSVFALLGEEEEARGADEEGTHFAVENGLAPLPGDGERFLDQIVDVVWRRAAGDKESGQERGVLSARRCKALVGGGWNAPMPRILFPRAVHE